ncbi:unnamed protein product [Orchesella dallaii]|uniref:Kinetochore protein Spc24 n=1 Tax=Orchesella dallaii TaxID=48710 RepID=A0ABP1PN73_9HEXA
MEAKQVERIEEVKRELAHALQKVSDLRKKLYEEEMLLSRIRIENQLAKLEEEKRFSMEVSANLRNFRLASVQKKFETEELAIRQSYESEQQLLYDSIKSDLEKSISRLEDDRVYDYGFQPWLVVQLQNQKSADLYGYKMKKAVTASGPPLVYELEDADIDSDWAVIKKALSAKRNYLDM